MRQQTFFSTVRTSTVKQYTCSALCLLLLALTGSSLPSAYPPTTEEGRAKVYYAVSVAYISVSILIENGQTSAMVLPTCGWQEVCASLSAIEQRDLETGEWKRASLVQSDGNVTTMGDPKMLGPGGSAEMRFRFHPSSWRFADGRSLAYPGKVRLMVMGWPSRGKNTMPSPDNKVELLSQEFDLPEPPETWGSSPRNQ